MTPTTSPTVGEVDVPTQLLIGGQWIDAAAAATFPVTNPATDEVIAHIANGAAGDGIRALDAASTIQHDWARTTPRRRSDILRAAFEMLRERRDEVATLMTLEMGKPLSESCAEVDYGAEFLRWFSEEAVRIEGRVARSPEGTGTIVVTHAPVGPTLLITPWNFPLAMATRKIAPAIAAGCTSIIKPAALTPLTTLWFARLLQECGLPDGVLNVVTTTSASALSAPLLSDGRLRKLSFTGSTEVGVALLRQAANGVLRTSMELGGNAPFLVFDDADIPSAVSGALQAKFRNVGQACTAANRFLVHESVAKEFAAQVTEQVSQLRIGDGLGEGCQIGPLINHAAVADVHALVTDAIRDGSTLLTGGERLERAGSFYKPTVLANVPPDCALMQQEVFGPVLSISTFRDEAEALALANSTEYGLVGYVYTRDIARVQRVTEALETGMIGLNVGVVSNAAAPFGGVKRSGLGREGGREGIHEFLETKYVLSCAM